MIYRSSNKMMSKTNVSDWLPQKIDKCCLVVKEHFDPSVSKIEKYVGLEHIVSNEFRLHAVSTTSQLRSGKFKFKSGHILFGRLRPRLKKICRVDFDGVCSTDIWVIDTRNGNDQCFFFYFLSSDLIIEHAIKSSEGTKMPRAKWNYLKKLIFPMPTIGEQKSIASILSEVDAQIMATQDVIEKSSLLRNGLMQMLLTRGIGHTKFKTVKTFFGKCEEIPTNWEQSKLIRKHMLELSSGTSAKNISQTGKYPVYGSNGIIGYVDNYNVEDTILIGRVGASGSVHYLKQKAYATDNVLISTVGNKLEKKFIYYALKYLKLERFSTKSAQPLLTQSSLKTIKILLPPLHEQKNIALILSEVDAYIQKNLEYKIKLENLKKGLMQNLLTGKIRV